MDRALFGITAIIAFVFALLYRSRSAKNKIFVQIYVLFVVALFLVTIGADWYVMRLDHAEFMRMTNTEHLSAAQQGLNSSDWDTADKHLDAIGSSSVEISGARDSLRQRVKEGRQKEEATEQQEDIGTADEADEDVPSFLDSISFIQHAKKMSVIVDAGWAEGEYRLCDIEVGETPDNLKCLVESPNKTVRMDVVFAGSMKESHWECKHRQDDILCSVKK
jgi:hypothetical protein